MSRIVLRPSVRAFVPSFSSLRIENAISIHDESFAKMICIVARLLSLTVTTLDNLHFVTCARTSVDLDLDLDLPIRNPCTCAMYLCICNAVARSFVGRRLLNRRILVASKKFVLASVSTLSDESTAWGGLSPTPDVNVMKKTTQDRFRAAPTFDKTIYS